MHVSVDRAAQVPSLWEVEITAASDVSQLIETVRQAIPDDDAAAHSVFSMTVMQRGAAARAGARGLVAAAGAEARGDASRVSRLSFVKLARGAPRDGMDAPAWVSAPGGGPCTRW